MKLSRFNYYYSIDGRNYVFNSLSESIIAVPGIEESILQSYSDILMSKGILVDSAFDDEEGLHKKITTISKMYGKVMDINIHVTNQCNLHCIGCYNESNQCVEDDFSRALRTINKEIINIRDLIDKGSAHRVSISISGGEPLLFLNRIKTIVDTCNGILGSRNHDFLLITNGTLLNKSVIKQMLEFGITDYYISVDSERYSLSSNSICAKASLFELFSNIQFIHSITNKRVIIRMNVTSTSDDFPILFMKWIKENRLSHCVILDFKRWYNHNELKNYYEVLPSQIQKLILFSHEMELSCLWTWRDNIDKYLACRMDTKAGCTVHPDGELTICPYCSYTLGNNDCVTHHCNECCFQAVCFGGCRFKQLNNTKYCDFEMIKKMVETHIIVTQTYNNEK